MVNHQEQLPDTPRVWLLTGHRAGDNAQVHALARLLAQRLPGAVALEEKRLSWAAPRLLPNLALPPTLAVLSRQARAAITPPWPRLVIGVGRRAVPVARWIQRRAPAARIVWLGRPRAPLAWFDLLLTTPQYGLPADAPNVMMLDLPPAQQPHTEEEVLAHWRRRLAHLPRPWIAVLVGGARWPVLFDARDAARLGEQVERLRALTGGSWIVSTSPRTGIRQSRALHEALRQPGSFHFWRGGEHAADPLKNPHRALLALADCFVVTADSASMLAEAVRTGRATHMFALRESALAVHWRARSGLPRALAASGLLSPPRDMRAFARNLAEKRLARWLHETLSRSTAQKPCPPPSDAREQALEEAVQRIASWFAKA